MVCNLIFFSPSVNKKFNKVQTQIQYTILNYLNKVHELFDASSNCKNNDWREEN